MSGGAQAGLFRAAKQSQGWEDARNHQASKVTKPAHRKGHQVGPKSHFSQRMSSALSLLGTKAREFCRHFFFLFLSIKESWSGDLKTQPRLSHSLFLFSPGRLQ